ncbi:hypothetical protein [Streptomyces glaucescens]|uniref:hypothetical protein n=1 Tax=Streptomyces glaucescens TaxID=1907 RepID=UPI000AB3DE1A|nr:hypothetical protein [Streptomyces glaucescens]
MDRAAAAYAATRDQGERHAVAGERATPPAKPSVPWFGPSPTLTPRTTSSTSPSNSSPA